MGADTTLYLIAYDIASDKRRTRVHKILSGFGQWTQFSLFECFLTEKQALQMRERLDAILEPEEDNVRIYTLCATCTEKVETIGSEKPEEAVAFIL